MLYHFEEVHVLLADHQCGFCPGRSCELQLRRIVNEWTQCLDNKVPIDVLYLDLQKAFDKVPHAFKTGKLQAFTYMV